MVYELKSTRIGIHVACLVFDGAPSAPVRGILRKNYITSDLNSWSNFKISRGILKPNSNRMIKRFSSVVIAMLRQLGRLIKNHKEIQNCNVIYVIKSPPKWFFIYIKLFKNNYILDFDDTIWINSWLGEEKFQTLVKNYSGFSCDNEIQLVKGLEYLTHGISIKGIIPVPKLIEHLSTENHNGKINLIWVGSKSTKHYLYSISKVIDQIFRDYQNVNLFVLGVSDDEKVIKSDRVTFIEYYDLETLNDLLIESNIGLFPILEDETGLTRGIHKAYVYLSAWIPVIATKTAMLEEFFKDHSYGKLCNSSEEWLASLKYFLEEPNNLKSYQSYISKNFDSRSMNLESTNNLFHFFSEIMNNA